MICPLCHNAEVQDFRTRCPNCNTSWDEALYMNLCNQGIPQTQVDHILRRVQEGHALAKYVFPDWDWTSLDEVGFLEVAYSLSKDAPEGRALLKCIVRNQKTNRVIREKTLTGIDAANAWEHVREEISEGFLIGPRNDRLKYEIVPWAAVELDMEASNWLRD